MAETKTSGTAAGQSGPDGMESGAFKLPDPALVGRSMADIAERSQRLVSEWQKRQPTE